MCCRFAAAEDAARLAEVMGFALVLGRAPRAIQRATKGAVAERKRPIQPASLGRSSRA